MPTGDKVIFPLTNQRVDKKDLTDMSVLIQETVARTVASLLGDGGGALTAVPFTWNTGTDTIFLGPCMLACSLPRTGDTSNNLLEGGVVIHDPSRPAQNGLSSINLDGANSGYLWFKRGTADVDVDNRAYWPAPGSGEQVSPVATRNREHVLFTMTALVDDSLINASSGWTRFATFRRITTDSPVTVAVTPISAIGDDRGTGEASISLMGTISEQQTAGANTPPLPASTTTSRKWGLNRLAQDTISNILQIKDSEVTFDSTTRAITANPNNTTWRTPAQLGIRQISSQLASLQEQIALISNNLVIALESTPLLLGLVYARVSKVDDIYYITLTTNFGTGATGIGYATFEATTVPNGVHQGYGVDVKIKITSSLISIDHIVATSTMRQDWRSGGAGDPDNQFIDIDTVARSCLTSYINFPKTSLSAPDAGDDPTEGDYALGLGEFVMRVKVAREDGSPRIEPFTLAVFGRKSQIINLGGVL
jgi:hypothetical protein